MDAGLLALAAGFRLALPSPLISGYARQGWTRARVDLGVP